MADRAHHTGDAGGKRTPGLRADANDATKRGAEKQGSGCVPRMTSRGGEEVGSVRWALAYASVGRVAAKRVEVPAERSRSRGRKSRVLADVPRIKSRGGEEVGSVRWVLAPALQSVDWTPTA
jgi:hypothetical protein